MKKSLLSWGALFACNFMWSLQFTCIKLVQDQVGAFSTVFIPMLIATIFMLPFVYKDIKKNRNRKFSDLKVFFMLALLGQFPAQVLMTIGTQQSTAFGTACLYSHTVITIVLTNTSKPPTIAIAPSFSCNTMAAMGIPKNVIKKLDNATCMASKFFNAVKNKIIDKKL